MRRVSSLEKDVVFERIWERWPNKENPIASEKIFNVCIDQGADIKLVEKSCAIYSIENEGQEYTYTLRNYLGQDLWKDYVEGCKDLDSYRKNLEERRNEAIKIIKYWNRIRRPFWCECLDIDSRVPVVTKALKDEFFKNNWKKALDNLRELFRIKPRENDKFRNLTFSLTWFCDTHKHTVLGIMEGQYGFPRKEHKPVKKIIINSEDSKKIAEENKILFKEVFGEVKKIKKTIYNDSKPIEDLARQVIRDVGIDQSLRD